MILLSHPSLNSNVRHVARALDRAGVLGEFWTRRESLQQASRCSTAALAATPSLLPPADAAVVPSLSRSHDREVSARLGSNCFTGIYAFEDAADASFRTAGERGMLRIYDLPMGHWRAEQLVCEEEALREPEWAATLVSSASEGHTIARKISELEQADLVFVSSTFLLKTLDLAPSMTTAVAILQAGGEFSKPVAPRVPAGKKLRALFIGTLGQRKGLSYLFRACHELRADVSLTVIGPAPIPCPALDRALSAIRWKPGCTAEEIRAEMAAHDVLIAPSLFDGFDPVIPEALAHGLPVIATANSAAPDLIADGVEGFIVPARSADEIVARLDLLRREPERLAHMSAQAKIRGLSQTWDTYERGLGASVSIALAGRQE